MFTAPRQSINRSPIRRRLGARHISGYFTRTEFVVLATWLCFAVPMALAGLACGLPDAWPVVQTVLVSHKAHALYAIAPSLAAGDTGSIFHAFAVASRLAGGSALQ